MNNFSNCLDLIFSNTLLSITLLCILFYATYTDIKYLKIYNKFNLLIIFIRVIFIFIPNNSLPFTFQNIIASTVAFTSFLAMAVIFMHKMGGDIKFIGAFMLFFNFEYMIVFVMIASILSLIYSVSVKTYLKNRKDKLLGNNNLNQKKENITLYYIVKIFLVKMPKDEEIIEMEYKDFNKYKLPFAPFFLMSYLITYILYLI